MSPSSDAWLRDVFAHELANAEAVAASASKRKPPTVSSYFEVLEQLDQVRRDLMLFGGRYGATKFGGAFDLRQICKAYMERPELRAEINRLMGLQ